MKPFSLSPALIAALVASSSASVCFAQINVSTSMKPSDKGGTNVGGIIGEGSTNTGGYTIGEGSTNVGGSEDGINIYSVNPWNSGIENAIRETKLSATYNFADNNIETAIKIYELQLEKISQTASNPEYQLSWTKKIADRTLDLTSRLDVSIKSADDRFALFNVYATTYDLIEEFYSKLDMGYIIPYRKNCNNKDFKMDLIGYEQQLNRYIVKQGDWFAQRFVAGSNEYGTLPKYSPKVFLVALSAISRGLAQDLLTDAVTGPNLFPHQYSSVASQLESISNKIDNHLAGGTVFSGKDDRAINGSYQSFQQVLSKIIIK
jgi:hypothetical protein